MRTECLSGRNGRWTTSLSALMVVALASCATATGGMEDPAEPTPAERGAATGVDPRVGLEAGWRDAGQAIWNLELVAHENRPEGFFNPSNMADFSLANTDIAFQGDLAFVGSYNGFQVWDISNPDDPTLRTAVVCPGGQGDVSVYEDLLFMSVEETRGRLDCGVQGVQADVSPERFRGVRIFDISDLDAPRQIAAVQTCRGSHTHTLVTDPDDQENVYIYVSGTSGVRPAEELEGCSGASPEEDPNTALFRIEVIQVPLAAPEQARIVNMPRIFADPETGDIAGLHEGDGRSAQTNMCHDITVYPDVGLAAGACSGNGIILDISDVANPVRIEETYDPNFAYWHSATFSNDASKVIFTDEWGGGAAPRCRASDRAEWGANAIFTLDDGELEHESYYKLPAPQTEAENCVAHNGSLIPVPGRDIMVQAWYQGGISVFDFTDPENPVEIAYFDRGPMRVDPPVLGGYWSAYWYNGYIYGSEIGRGLDVFRLEPSEHLTQNEIDAAMAVQVERFNPQHQDPIIWPTAVAIAKAYLDQLVRHGTMTRAEADRLAAELDRGETGARSGERLAHLEATIADLETRARAANTGDAERLRFLAATFAVTR